MSKVVTAEKISATNLSLGWAAVLDRVMQSPTKELAPLHLSIMGFDEGGVAAEVPALRSAVDSYLHTKGIRSVEIVAWTLFPQRYWLLAQGDREAFFAMFIEAFQRIQHFNPANNRRGSYFQRMVDFDGGGKGPNQLKWMLDEYDKKPTARRSKWQLCTFDPKRDLLTAPYMEFPCMQQLSIGFTDAGGVMLNAFYATQQIVHKAYGNYLGLARLGAFIASQMGRPFECLNVFVGIAKIDNVKRKSAPEFRELLATVRSELAEAEGIRYAA